jgi:putative transposase
VLATPQTAEGLPQIMQAIGRSYVRYFNTAQNRTGTLWDGRYRSTVLQADQHLLACMAYIDLNPVRSALVDGAAVYPWSSHGHYLGRKVDKCITPHALFWALGNTPFAREAAYAQLVRDGLSSAGVAGLTDATLKGWALGDAAFLAEIQKQTPRRLAKAKAGRPTVADKVSV